MDVVDAKLKMVPDVRHRVFEVQHHSGRAGIQHFYHQLGVVCRAGHLVALVLAPLRQRDAPFAGRRFRRRKMIRQLTPVSIGKNSFALGD